MTTTAREMIFSMKTPKIRKKETKTDEKHDEKPISALDRVSAYAQAVLDGDIVAGPHVRNACRRHFDDLETAHERGIFFSEKAAAHIFRFFEKGLTLSDGQFEGKPFKLAPSQAFKLGSLFGWKKVNPEEFDTWKTHFDPNLLSMGVSRRFRRAYIEEGKGNGKSPLAGGIGLFGMLADDEPAAQIYAAAAKKAQAQILYQDAVKAARRSPTLFKEIGERGFSGGIGKEFNMLHVKSMSFFRPISKEDGKTGSGPRPHMALCDEVHEHPDRSIMEMLERGFKFRENPLLLMITNSGHDLTSVCWEEHVHAVKVAAGDKDMQPAGLAEAKYKGVPFDDSTFSFVCALDPGDDPLTDSSCWIKANPMLGVILKNDYLEGVVKQANDMPGKRNGILRLHFCVWTDSIDGWMAQEKVEAIMHEFNPEEVHAEKSVCAAIDLSGTRDLTAMAFGTETGEMEVERVSPEGEVSKHLLPTYDVWVEAWTPLDNIKAREDEDKIPYSLWADQKYLHAVAGERIRYDHVASRLLRASNIFKIAGVAYDNYAYSKFREECDDMGVDVKHFAHPQGGKNRAKPTIEEEKEAKDKGEKPHPGLWMPGSIKLFEDAVLDGRIRIRFSPVVMAAMMGATMSPEDDMGNKWFVKRKSNAKIDPAVAIAMCLGLLDKMRRAPKKAKIQVFFAGG